MRRISIGVDSGTARTGFFDYCAADREIRNLIGSSQKNRANPTNGVDIMRSRTVSLYSALSIVLLAYSAATPAIELDDSLESTISVVGGGGDLLDGGVLGGRGLPIAGDLLDDGDGLPVAGRLLSRGVLGDDLPVVGGVFGGDLPVVGGLPLVGNLLDDDELPIIGGLLGR
jgi:hypothetical protein